MREEAELDETVLFVALKNGIDGAQGVKYKRLNLNNEK